MSALCGARLNLTIMCVLNFSHGAAMVIRNVSFVVLLTVVLLSPDD